jgi:hypothetical protein
MHERAFPLTPQRYSWASRRSRPGRQLPFARLALVHIRVA